MAVTPYLSLGARCLICLEGWSDLRWDSLTPAPFPLPPLHVRLRSRGKHFWLLCRVWDSPEFLLYDPGGRGQLEGTVAVQTVTWSGCCFENFTVDSQSLPRGAGAELWRDLQPFCSMQKCKFRA